MSDVDELRAELAKVRAKSEERRRLLEEIHTTLVGAHESACVPTWTAYDRHEPNSHCEYIEPIAAALSDDP